MAARYPHFTFKLYMKDPEEYDDGVRKAADTMGFVVGKLASTPQPAVQPQPQPSTLASALSSSSISAAGPKSNAFVSPLIWTGVGRWVGSVDEFAAVLEHKYDLFDTEPPEVYEAIAAENMAVVAARQEAEAKAVQAAFRAQFDDTRLPT